MIAPVPVHCLLVDNVVSTFDLILLILSGIEDKYKCLDEFEFRRDLFVLFCLRLYVPVNNFSVILGRLPAFNQ